MINKKMSVETELERKFYLSKAPPQEQLVTKIHIQQSYASLKPVVRVRKITQDGQEPKYIHTVKYWDAEDTRTKVNSEMSKFQYDTIFAWIAQKPVEKDREIYDLGGGLQAKVDLFATGECLVEVEFLSPEAMKAFVPPSWFSDELPPFASVSVDCFQKINGIYQAAENIFSLRSNVDQSGMWGK